MKTMTRLILSLLIAPALMLAACDDPADDLTAGESYIVDSLNYVDDNGFVQSSTPGAGLWVPQSIVVRTDGSLPLEDVAAYVGGEVRNSFEFYSGHFAEIQIPESVSVEGALAMIGQRVETPNLHGVNASNVLTHKGTVPGVLSAEPNYYVTTQFVPNDPFYTTNQYAPQITNAPKAWEIEQGDPEVVVAVIDTGVDYHQEFRNRLGAGWDFLNNVPTAPRVGTDDNLHGTHVAGIAAAQGNDRTGMAGSAWNVEIMPLKVLGGRGGGSFFAVAEAMVMVANGPKANSSIINMSLGAPFWTLSLQDVTSYVVSKGVTILASAGNSSTYELNFPAGHSGIIGVGASNSDDRQIYFSSRGWHVDITAPGTNILAPFYNSWDRYLSISGTSMSSPFAAGYGALLKSANPELTPIQVQEVMEITADPLHGKERFKWRSDQGFGRINLGNGVELARNIYENKDNPNAWTWTDSDGTVQTLPDLTGSPEGWRYGNLHITMAIDADSIVDGPPLAEDVPLVEQDVMLMTFDQTEVLQVGRTSDGMSIPEDDQSTGVLPPGVIHFDAVPAGDYWIKAHVERGDVVERQVRVTAGETTKIKVVMNSIPLVNYMVSTFPIYNNTDPDLRLGRPQDANDSPNVLNALMRIQRLEGFDGLNDAFVAFDRGGNGFYFNFNRAPLRVEDGFEYIVSHVSFLAPDVFDARLDLNVGYYGMAVTNDLFSPVSHRISDEINALPKSDPEYRGNEPRSLDFFWLDPEGQTWLTQQGEFFAVSTEEGEEGSWIDLNFFPSTSPDTVRVSNQENLIVETGYLHLGDTDIWILDLTGDGNQNQ